MNAHPLLAWSLAGAISAALVVASGGLAGWAGEGSVGLALGGGSLAWLLAGWASLPRNGERSRRAAAVLAVVWGIAGVLALLMAVRLGALTETLRFGDRLSEGVFGLVLGVGIGGALGGWMTATIAARRRPTGVRLKGAVVGAVACLVAFALGGYIATVTGIVMSELWQPVEGWLGRYGPAVVGWGIGGAVGGFVGGVGVWMSGRAGRRREEGRW